jgi:hypothetical protein
MAAAKLIEFEPAHSGSLTNPSNDALFAADATGVSTGDSVCSSSKMFANSSDTAAVSR